MARKENSSRLLLPDGVAVTVRVLDSYLIDDVVTHGAKAEAYRVSTGKDLFPTLDRKIKDYLIKVGVILE